MGSIQTPLQPFHRNFERQLPANGRFPDFQKPHIVGSFSVDRDRKCHLDDRRFLQFVRKCPAPSTRVHLDLNVGYDNVIRKLESARHEKLDHLLTFIVANMNQLRVQNDERFRLKADVVAWRGLLRLLMTSPFERKEAWCILATRYRGTVYLCAYETDRMKMERLKRENPSMMRIFSYGFKFEQYQQTRVRNEQPDTSMPVNESEEFCCLFAGRLELHKLFYGAEMDGVSEENDVDLDTVDLNTVQLVEMKVNRRAIKPWDRQNFYRFKLRNWWCQCFLAGVQKVIVGERTDEGIVDKVYEMAVRDFPRLASGNWDAKVCMLFLDSFLTMVKTEMADINCATTVFRFDYDPQSNENVQVQHINGASDLTFLPDWYIDAIKKADPLSVNTHM